MSVQNLSSRLQFEELRSLAAGSISGTYMGVGTSLNFPARTVLVQNYTDQRLIFSLDGITDHFVLDGGTQLIFDIQANKSNMEGFYMAAGDRLYVKEDSVTPLSGSVYFSTIYGKE